MKKLTSLLALGALLILGGAGCPPLDTNSTAEEPAASPATSAPTASEETFTVAAEALGSGAVKVSWNTPADADPTSVFRVVHGNKPNPTYPGGYWFQRSDKTVREATLTNLPKGLRYLRVCEFKNNQCVKYSNELEVDVK